MAQWKKGLDGIAKCLNSSFFPTLSVYFCHLWRELLLTLNIWRFFLRFCTLLSGSFFIQVEALYVFQSNLFLLMKYFKQIFLRLLSVRFLPNYNFSFSFNLNKDCWQSQIASLSSFRWAKILTRKGEKSLIWICKCTKLFSKLLTYL